MASVRSWIAFVALLGLCGRPVASQSPVEAPLSGRPTNFSHLVGQFSITATAEPTSVSVEDAIRLRVSIAGVAADGVRPSRSQLRVFPDGFASEFFIEPLPDSDLSRIDGPPTDGSMAVSGQWDFVWRLRPKSTAIREVPSLALSYYSPAVRRFQTARSDAIDIVVTPRQRSIARAELPSDLPASFLELSGWRPGDSPDVPHWHWGRVGLREFSLFSSIAIALSAALWALRRGHRFARHVAEPAAIGEILRRPEAVRAVVAEYWRTALGVSTATPMAEEITRRLKRLNGARGLERDWILWLGRADAAEFCPGRGPSPETTAAIANDAIDLILRTNSAIIMTNGKWIGSAKALGAVCLLSMTTVALANDQSPSAETWRLGQTAFTDAAEKLRRDEPDDGGMERAARFFRKGPGVGPISAGGYRDLGNALFLSGDLPGAIAAFRRGLTLDPYDRILAQHLEFARRQVAVPNDVARPDTLWTTNGTVSAFAGVGLVVGALGCLALPIGVWLRSRSTVIVGAVAISVGFIAAARLDRANVIDGNSPDFAILVEDTPLRMGNGERYAPVADLPTLPKGLEVLVLGERGGWLHVQLPAGQIGWLPKSKSLRDP